MLKILNLLPIKIISATINHLPSISATYFMVPLDNRSKKEQKVTDLPDGTRVLIDLDQRIGK